MISFLFALFSSSFPFEISGYGDDDVETIEPSLEWDTFYYIEIAANGIYKNPEEPLFYVFPCQGPQTHKAQGIGEAILQWYRGVGKGNQNIIGDSPCCQKENSGREIE